MAGTGNNKNKVLIIGISCLVIVCLICSAFFVLKMLLKDDGKRRKRQIQRVTLVKPPPPPKIKEKPPEPEVKKKEEIVEPEPEETPPEDMEDSSDEPPPGEDLGLDADGTGGADGFGLKAKKGGRSLIAGGIGGKKSLLKRYAWYVRILQEEVREQVNQYLEDKEDLPSGKHRMLLRLKLDSQGNMVSYTISRSSGDSKVDDAVKKGITGFKVSEAPPDDMPRILKLKVTFKS